MQELAPDSEGDSVAMVAVHLAVVVEALVL
jgi:hypothetical protein